MNTHFIEASNGGNHGKFLVARFDAEEARVPSALPGYTSLPVLAGRKFTQHETLVMDLQTGEGAAFTLEGMARADLRKHRIWVCPLFEPFLEWLYQQGLGRGRGDISALPRYVDLPHAEFAMAGYRRPGPTSQRA